MKITSIGLATARLPLSEQAKRVEMFAKPFLLHLESLRASNEVTYIHKYIIGHSNPSVSSFSQRLLILYVRVGIYSLKSIPKDRFLNNFSW